MSFHECSLWTRVPPFVHDAMLDINARVPWTNWTPSIPRVDHYATADEPSAYSAAMEKLYYWGTIQTQVIQDKFAYLENPFIDISSIFDPANLFMVLFPLIYFFSISLSTKLVVAASVTEWVNLCLKWLLHEHRPYMWAGENRLQYNIDLRQTAITCETGPGSPSGHVMGNSTVYFLLVHHLAKHIPKTYRPLLWALFYLTIFFIAVSRVYIAAHFPHQVIFGLVLGIAVAKFCDSNLDTDKWRLPQFARFTAFLFTTGMISHWIVGHVIKMDPEKSVKLALKWCSDPSRVHVNTTPFFGFMRFIGIPLGLGLGMHMADFPSVAKMIRTQMPFFHRVMAAVAAYLIGVAIFKMPSGTNMILMCLFAFVRYVFFAFVVSYVVPKVVQAAESEESGSGLRQSTSNNNYGALQNGKSKHY